MTHIDSILISLNQHQFQQAQALISSKLSSNPSDSFLKLLLGVCLVEQHEKDGWTYIKDAFTHHFLPYCANGEYSSHFLFYLQNMFSIHQQYFQQAKTFQKVLHPDSSNFSAYCQLYSTYTLIAALETSSKTLSCIKPWINFQQIFETYHYVFSRHHAEYYVHFCFWMQMLRSRDDCRLHDFIRNNINKELFCSTFQNSIEFLRLQFTILFMFSGDPILLKDFLQDVNIKKFQPIISDEILDNTNFLVQLKCSNFYPIAKTFLKENRPTCLTNEDFQRFLYLFYYLLLNPSISYESLDICFSAVHEWWLSSLYSFSQDNALLNIFCFFQLNNQKIRSDILPLVPHHKDVCSIFSSQQKAKQFLLKYLLKWKNNRLLFSFIRPILSLFSQETLYQFHDDLILLYQNSVSVKQTSQHFLLTLQRCLTALAQPVTKTFRWTCDMVFYSFYKDIQTDPTTCQDLIERFLMILQKILLYQTKENISYLHLILKLTHHVLPKNYLADFRFQYILLLLYSYYGFPNEALKLWKTLHIKCLQNISLGWIVTPQLFRQLDITAAHQLGKKILSSKHQLHDSIWDIPLNYIFENMKGNYLAHTLEFKKKLNESQIMHSIVIQHMFSSFLLNHTSSFSTFTTSLQKAMYGVIEPKLEEPHERYLALINTEIGYEFIHEFDINKPQLFHELNTTPASIFYDPLFDVTTYINSFTLMPSLYQPNSQLAFLNNSDTLENKPFLSSLAYPNPFKFSKPSATMSFKTSSAGFYFILESLASIYENDVNRMATILFLSTALVEGRHEWLEFSLKSKKLALILTKTSQIIEDESLGMCVYQEFLSLTAKFLKLHKNNKDANTYADALPILKQILTIHKAILNNAFILPCTNPMLTKMNLLHKRYNGFLFLILFKAFAAYLISLKSCANNKTTLFFLKEILYNLNDAYQKIDKIDLKLLDISLPESIETIESEFLNLPILHEKNFPLTPFESFKKTTLRYLKNIIQMYQSEEP